jgi:hypothetical protein
LHNSFLNLVLVAHRHHFWRQVETQFLSEILQVLVNQLLIIICR